MDATSHGCHSATPLSSESPSDHQSLKDVFLVVIYSVRQVNEKMRLWELGAAFPVLPFSTKAHLELEIVCHLEFFGPRRWAWLQAVSALWRSSEERILQCLWVLAMSNDSEDAWESDTYVGSFPPVFHPWAGIQPRPLPWLIITGSTFENVEINGKHLVAPVRLPIHTEHDLEKCASTFGQWLPHLHSPWGCSGWKGLCEFSGASKVHTR